MEEQWRDFEYNGAKYRVSSQGRIMGMRGKLLKSHLNEDGYAVVTIGIGKKRTTEAIHRIVARVFIEKPDNNVKYEVNHKDCNRENNCVENLEWVTHQQNVKHSYQNNREVQYVARDGIKNGRATFNDEEVLSIRKLYNESGYSIADLARLFHSKYSTIGNIVHNQTWKHLL